MALAYVLTIALVLIGGASFVLAVPRSIDTGAAVVSRALAYGATFAEVERARAEVVANDLDTAKRRLKQFLNAHRGVQRSQLYTHAVIDAHELLALIHTKENRLTRAVKTLEKLTDLVPRHYRAWHLRGLAEIESGDPVEAAKSFDRAFRLSPIIPTIADDYLSLLAELARFEEILWVADQYDRAQRRAAPVARVKIGVLRSASQRLGLAIAGIPIEQGVFSRDFEVRGLARGSSRAIPCPSDLFRDWPADGESVSVQVRLEHVDRDFRVDGLRWRLHGKLVEHDLPARDVRYLHLPYSTREFYAEFVVDLDLTDKEGLEIIYSCPTHRLGAESLAIIEKATANLAPARGRR